MSTSTPVVLDAAATRPDPIAGARRSLVTALAVVAPVLLAVGTVVAPELHGTNQQVTAALAPVAGRLLAAHLLNGIAGVAYLAVVAVLWRIPVAAGGVLRFAGGCVLALGFVADAFGELVYGYTAWAGVQAGVPAHDLAAMFDVLDAAPAALPLAWFAVPVAEIGGLVLLVGVLRARRAVPLWAPIVAIAGVVASAVLHAGPGAAVGFVAAAGLVATVVLAARSARP